MRGVGLALSSVPARTRTAATSPNAPKASGYGVRGCTLALGARGTRAEAGAGWAGVGTAEGACETSEIGKEDGTLIVG
jgi:hypothetical protein